MNKKTFMPKTFTLFFTLLIAGGISALSLTGCGIINNVAERIRARQQEAEREAAAPETGDEADLPDVVFLDTRAISEWDYLIVTKEEAVMTLNVNEATGVPTLLFLKPQKDLDISFTFTFKENGLLDAMVYSGYFFYYSNYRDYRYDMAIVAPNGIVEYHYGIQTDIDWDAVKLSGDEFTPIALSDAGRTRPAALDLYRYGAGIGAGWNAVAPAMPGRTGGGGGPYLPDWGLGAPDFWDENKDTTRIIWDCVGYAITAGLCAGTFVPGLSPIFAAGCITNLAGYFLENTVELLDALDWIEDTTAAGAGLTINTASLILDAVGCAGASVTKAIDCVEAFHGFVSIVIGDDLEVLIDSTELVEILEDTYFAEVNFYDTYRFDPEPESMRVEKGTTITLPQWEKPPNFQFSYDFLGWGTNPDDGYAILGSTHTINDNTTLYAKWYNTNENVPKGVTAEAVSSSSIRISWDAKDGAIAYYIYRGELSRDSDGPVLEKDRLGTVWTPNTTFLDTGLPERRFFVYAVTYTTGPGESERSAWAGATTLSHVVPGPPSSISAGANSSTSITVNWLAVDNATSYEVYRGEAGGHYSLVATVDAPAFYYRDNGLSPDTTYYYVVKSLNFGKSAASDYATATTYEAPPGSYDNPIRLIENIWTDGSITSYDRAVWYSFDVVSGNTYYVWWNDLKDGDSTKTIDVVVGAYRNIESRIFYEEDSGWTRPRSITANSSGTLRILVGRDYFDLSGDTGTFAVAYSTTNTRPLLSGDGDYTISGSHGTFTLTGIPSGFNGMYAMLVAYTDDTDEIIEGFESWTGGYNSATLTFPRVYNGQVVIPVWTIRSRGRDVITEASPYPVQYTGNHTFDDLSVIFYRELSITGGHEALLRMDYDMTLSVNGEYPFAAFDNVRFSDGRASRTWRENTFNEYGGGSLPDNEDLSGISSIGGFGSWPPPNVLTEYGLSGLTAPSGATNLFYGVIAADDMSILSVSFQGSQANDSTISRWFTSNGWSQTMAMNTSDMSMWYYEKRGFTGVYTRSGTDCTISSIKQ